MVKRRHVINSGQPYIVGGGGSVSGGSASPLPYSDLVYLFDARSGVTTSGSAVTSWAPVVGAEALAQATASNQPTLTTLNGHAVIDFDGSDDLTGSTTKLGYAPPTGATITGITSANPGVVTTSAAHGFSNGNTVVLDSLAGDMAPLNGISFEVTVVSATEFSLGMDLSSLAYASGGTATLGGHETVIIVWTSDAAAPSGVARGLAGWSSNANGRFWHLGSGTTQVYGDAISTYKGSSTPTGIVTTNLGSGLDATKINITARLTYSYALANRSDVVKSLEAGASAPTTNSFASGSTALTPAARTSAGFSCGAYVSVSDPTRCLDGKIHAIYYWNRVLADDELTRTMTRIGGIWRG